MHTSHILHRRLCEPTSIVDWPKLVSVNRNLPLIGCCARQSQRTHSHSFGCPFQWGGPKTLLSERRLDKHNGNLHSNKVIGCDSELVFLFQSGLRNLQTHASNDHPPHYFMNEVCCSLATRSPVVPPLLSSHWEPICQHGRQSHSFTSAVTPMSHTLGKKDGQALFAAI